MEDEKSRTPDGWIRKGALLGLVGAAFFSLMWTSAVIADGHWVLGEETLSELGGDRPGALFFNAGVIVEGILAIFFSAALWRSMRPRGAFRIGPALFLAASVALIAVGAFPITTGLPHTVASYAFFGLALLAVLAIAYPIWEHRAFGPLAGIASLAAAAISVVFLLATNVPTAEAVAVICLLGLTVLLSSMMLARG